ncbi:hypothetical protein N7523_009782 [Penicillium sp. IBT 18751x]|nr:hypothetical protein N7523_009782 [Penicillium sp. IBT 18751x]
MSFVSEEFPEYQYAFVMATSNFTELSENEMGANLTHQQQLSSTDYLTWSGVFDQGRYFSEEQRI